MAQESPQADFLSIPIVDVGPLVQGAEVSQDACKQAASALHAACRDVGFFYVTNHGVPESLYRGVLDASRQWFTLPQEEKNSCAIRPGQFRGYQALGTNVVRYDGGFQRDWHEALDYFREVGDDHTSARGPQPLHGMNPWPTSPPGYADLLKDYTTAMMGLGQAVMRGIALGCLGDDRPHEISLQESFWIMRVIGYPPLEPESQQHALEGEIHNSVRLSCGEHTDYGLLTIVNQDDAVSALQVKNRGGKWVTAHPIPGAFVINIGDMLRIWSNGLYQPTPHRVINASHLSRVSVPFFYEPDFDAVIRPHPHLLMGEGDLEEEVVYGDHLRRKIYSNFEL